MNQPIYFDYPTVQQAAQNYAKRQEGLNTILSDLETNLAPMLASWEGSARDLYFEQKTVWDNAAKDLTSLLQEIAGLTQNAHDGYTKVVSDVKTLWS
jgi:early secretory antigenic target protein ESAT-6